MCAEKKDSRYYTASSREKPFWNAEAIQFMYAPAFQFQPIPGCKKYLYEIKDEAGGSHCFFAASACASLSPVWDNISEGITELEVYSSDSEGNKKYKIGARTFFRLAPFSDDLPKADCSYRECALKAFDFMFNDRIIRHWLDFGTPDPQYDLNVYPSKMVASVISSMLQYGKFCPERSADCLKIAENAADWLISITEPDTAPLAGLPPTYYTAFREKDDTMSDLTAADRSDTIMMFYPASAGRAYLLLEKETGKKKYLDAAYRIAEYYRDNILESGSWYLVVSRLDGKPVTENLCMPTNYILEFLSGIYERTGEKIWKELADRGLAYIENGALATYHWEGQFEDSVLSLNYSNLAHGDCDQLIRYYASHHPDDEEKMLCARELMQFAEDQFVVWKRPCPWNKDDFDISCWPTPCGLEQYNWYVPVDGSTANIALSFLAMYKATGEKIYLSKARALMNTLTRVQNKRNGRIPTEWIKPGFIEKTGDKEEIWINCLLYSACALMEMAEYEED